MSFLSKVSSFTPVKAFQPAKHIPQQFGKGSLLGGQSLLNKSDLFATQRRFSHNFISFKTDQFLVKDKFTTPQTIKLANAQKTPMFQKLLEVGRTEEDALAVLESTTSPDEWSTMSLKAGDALYAVASHKGDRSHSAFFMTENQLVDHLARFGTLDFRPDDLNPVQVGHTPDKIADSLALPGSNTAQYVIKMTVVKDGTAVVSTTGRTQSEVSYLDPKTGQPTGPKLNTDRSGGAEQVTPPPGSVKQEGVMTVDALSEVFKKYFPLG